MLQSTSWRFFSADLPAVQFSIFNVKVKQISHPKICGRNQNFYLNRTFMSSCVQRIAHFSFLEIPCYCYLETFSLLFLAKIIFISWSMFDITELFDEVKNRIRLVCYPLHKFVQHFPLKENTIQQNPFSLVPHLQLSFQSFAAPSSNATSA